MSFDTPILLMVFNRPDTTRQVLDAVRKVKPKFLFVAADGPRADKPGEAERCQEVRDVFKTIDWDCKLRTLYRGQNLGCGHGPANAISWFFSNVEQGIILEDDCVPDESFFSYCAELLHRYKGNEQVMHISGNNFLAKKFTDKESYYFTKYFTAWGWATWRRAWQHYDFNVKFVDAFLNSDKFDKLALNSKQSEYWKKIAEMVKDGKRGDIWDYQWMLTCWNNNGYAIIPVVNLVTNIGFGADATHTVDDSWTAYVKTGTIDSIVHPASIVRNTEVDKKTFDAYFEPPQHLNKARGIMYKIFPNSVMRQVQKLRRKLFPDLK